MKSFSNLKHGEQLRNVDDNSVLSVVVWRGETYLAGKSDMWSVDEFDPRDWELLNC